MNELCVFTNLSSREWAAWVQATLSGIAIFVAVMMPWIQHRRDLKTEARRRKAEKNEQVRVFEMIMMHAALATNGAADVLLNATTVDHNLALDIKVHLDIVAETNEMVRKIPFHELPSAAVIRSAYHLSRTSTKMEDYLSRLKLSLEKDDFNLADAKSMAKTQHAQTTKRLRAFRHTVAEFCDHQSGAETPAIESNEKDAI